MRVGVNLGCLASLGLVLLLCLGSALTIWQYRDADIPVLGGLFAWFVSLPLALVVGLFASSALLQHLLHALYPPRLDGDSAELRLRMWRTWGGPFGGFRRTDARVPRVDIDGVALGTAQGGASQLFLIHASGARFYAGFTGERRRAKAHAEAILHWLAHPR